MTIPGGYVAGDILTAANMNLLPAGKVGYAAVTADQTAITTVTDLTSLTVTWTAVSARRYRISFHCTFRVDSGPSTITVPTVQITDGSNNIKQTAYGNQIPAGVTSSNDLMLTTVAGSVTETSLSGSTTRKLRALSQFDSTTADTIALIASATGPAYILVEDIGPA